MKILENLSEEVKASRYKLNSPIFVTVVMLMTFIILIMIYFNVINLDITKTWISYVGLYFIILMSIILPISMLEVIYGISKKISEEEMKFFLEKRIEKNKKIISEDKKMLVEIEKIL